MLYSPLSSAYMYFLFTLLIYLEGLAVSHFCLNVCASRGSTASRASNLDVMGLRAEPMPNLNDVYRGCFKVKLPRAKIMNSSFSSHYVQSLAISLVLPAASEARPTSKKQSLQSLVASTRQLLSYSDTRKALESLERIERDYTDAFSATHVDSEEYALKRAVIGKVVVCLYAEALDTYLSEASDAEAEAEWWADVERSRQNVAYYLLQSEFVDLPIACHALNVSPAFPARVINLTRTILRTLQTRNIPLTPSIFTPSSLRRLFPTNNALRPNVLTTALFPHLKTHPHTVTLTYVSSEEPVAGGAKTANSILLWAQSILRIFTLPYELTTHECRIKRKELEKLRDERAEVLGALTNMRSELASALTEVPQGLHMDGFQMDDKLASFVDILCRVAVGELMSPATSPPLSYVSSQQDIVSKVQTLADVTLHTHKAQHANYLASRNLMRPSRLTLMWPRLLILPLLTAYLVREAYRSRASLAEMAKETGETIQNFFKDWLLEPIMDVVKTIRAGGEEGVIVRKEGVVADFNVRCLAPLHSSETG